MQTLPKIFTLWLATVLAACSIKAVTFTQPSVTVGGTITGLDGTGLVLTNNGGDDLTIASNGTFEFTTQLPYGERYAVVVKRQPSSPTQVCTVANDTSTAGDANVTDVQVSCRTTAFRIGGTVTGLAGAGLVLQNNGGDNLSVSADGTFTFATPVMSGATYAVAVGVQPSLPTQACTVTSGTGTVGASDVMNVTVTCTTRTFTIGGVVTGLLGSGLVLQDNGGDNLSINADGSFLFAAPLASGASFAVTVLTQPALPTQTCTVSGGTGTVGSGNVTSVAIDCTVNRYTVGGTVSGLVGKVTLQNSGGDDLDVTSNGTFAFATPVPSGSTYSVTVKTQPTMPWQTCTLTADSGTVTNANITSVVLSCTTNRYAIGGTLSGLAAGDSITLRDNGGDDLTLSANGGFAFPTQVTSGQPYAVTVVANPTSPISQTCTVTSGSGLVAGSDVNDVQVTCTTNRFTIGGTISGLAGTGLVLQDNAGDNLSVSADGAFTFATPIASGATYAVTVAVQPSLPTQACTVTSGTGSVSTSNVTSVAITCVTRTFTIGGTVTGLSGSGLVLQDNGGDSLPIGADGSFTFPTPIASGETFMVTVGTQPAQPTQTCTVAGGTGTVGAGNVTSVAVNCTTNRYMIGGTVSGLIGKVTLQNNGGDDLDVTTNGGFAFSTSVASGSSYSVTVKTQPTGPTQTCVVVAASGTVTNTNVTSIAVTCTTNRYSVRGTLAGLAAGDSITLRDNGGDDLPLSANGSFTFPTQVTSGQPYAVTVVANPTSPISQTCTITNGSGVITDSDVTSVEVTCTTDAFTVGGTVSGLTSVGLVLQDNGGNDLAITGNGTFTFPTPLPSGSTYVVTVLGNPTGELCTVSNGSGSVAASNVTNVAVTCRGPTGAFFYSATNTSSATQNTFNFNIAITAGQTLTIGTCGVPGSSGSGDTFLRLFGPSNNEVAFNDDACGGLLTNFTFTAATTGIFQVRAGCFLGGSCSGTVSYILSP